MSSIYSGKTSSGRIDKLAEHLLRVVEDVNEPLDEILFFLDDFEGGSSESENFERVLAFIIGKLSVDNENAQRLFDFFKYCRNVNVYGALTGAFYNYLTVEQKRLLPPTYPST